MHNKKLKDYFPLIRERESILSEIKNNKTLSHTFNSWPQDFQNEFLDICTGIKGIKVTYDSFFKEIFNAEYNAPVLNAFISALLGTTIAKLISPLCFIRSLMKVRITKDFPIDVGPE